MSYRKWIYALLGTCISGISGGIVGFLMGAAVDGIANRRVRIGDSSDSSPFGDAEGTHRGPYRNNSSEEDINTCLMILIAAILKADGQVRRSELDYVKSFLAKSYSEEKGKSLLIGLRELVKPEVSIDIRKACQLIKQNTDYTTRYHMVDFLFGLAMADNSYHSNERVIITTIATQFGINARDYASMYARHIGGRDDSYHSWSDSSNGGRSHGGSQKKDPYKILGLTAQATDAEVKRAYRSLAMKYHPDKVEGMGEEVKRNAEAQFREINEAYEQIKTARGMK